MPIRPLYSCTVHISGSRDNSVFLPTVTAAEIAVLRVLHGNGDLGAEPVINIKPLGKGLERSDAAERARIAARYIAQGKFNGIAVLNALYGINGVLPVEYVPPERQEVEPTDTPAPEEEKLIDLSPQGPITSMPAPEKKKKESLLDA